MALNQDSLDIAEQTLRTDVLIVGAGPLGLTASIGLSRLGVEHIVAESGSGLVSDAQELADGAVIAGRYPDLIATRIRALGGTTHIWGGHSAPLRPIDFTARPWLGLKKWPVAYEEFRSWFSRVTPLFRLPDDWAVNSLERLPDMVTQQKFAFFSAEAYRLSPVNDTNNFWETNKDDIRGRIIERLTARALGFEGDGAVRSVRFSRPDGSVLEIRANQVILAMGGIETARFLLINRRNSPNTPLSMLDLIGRGFIEHPHPHMADVHFFRPMPHRVFFGTQRDGSSGHVGFFLKESIQREARLPSFYFRLAGRLPVNSFNRRYRAAALVGIFEQLPDDARRVTISDSRTDSLGDPLVELSYAANHFDIRSIVEGVNYAGRDLAMAGWGRLRVRMEHPDPETPIADLPWVGVGHHHMGTVRMGLSPADGVVDANLRVFGTRNLYIASTGVFPSGSCVNPTMNGAAFALRLAHHVERSRG